MGRKTTKKIGDKFGHLEIIKIIPSNKKGKHVKTICLCHNCKKTKTMNSVNLHKRNSCGCLQRNSEEWKLKGPKTKPWQLPPGESAKRSLEYQYKREAKKRKLEYTLTSSDFFELIIKECSYCGKSLTNIKKGQGKTSGNFPYTGIDRIDSSKGYIIGNVVPCCWTCNSMKKDMTVSDFINHANQIVQHYNNLNRKSTN